MKESFTLQRAYVVSADEPSLRSAIKDHTGSEDETTSILRTLERMGSDASIRHYDVSPVAVRRTYRGDPPVTWSVRAVRA
jgi:hypothetical protein